MFKAIFKIKGDTHLQGIHSSWKQRSAPACRNIEMGKQSQKVVGWMNEYCSYNRINLFSVANADYLVA